MVLSFSLPLPLIVSVIDVVLDWCCCAPFQQPLLAACAFSVVSGIVAQDWSSCEQMVGFVLYHSELGHVLSTTLAPASSAASQVQYSLGLLLALFRCSTHCHCEYYEHT